MNGAAMYAWRKVLPGIFSIAAFICACHSALAVTACPAKPGIYASVDEKWTEIPRESDPVTTFKPNYFEPSLPKTNKEFAGEKAFVSLRNPLQLCVVGASTGTSFSLEKAVAKKGTRTIVQIGDFHNNKGSQSQPMASLTDEQGNIHLMTTALEEGQYILVMLGAFAPMPKPSSGNAQTDATAALMESTTAMVQSMSNGRTGINFGIGIE